MNIIAGQRIHLILFHRLRGRHFPCLFSGVTLIEDAIGCAILRYQLARFPQTGKGQNGHITMTEKLTAGAADENRLNPEWSNIITEEQWRIYRQAIRATRKTKARFLLGGAFSLAGYTGRCRNTKDLDFFVLPSDKDKIVDALTKAGFDDYYSTMPYDRGWIYRATKNDVIVDTIWQTPNRRTEVDEDWFTRAKSVVLRNEGLEIVPAEELLAIKLYVMQRDRCDWPDLINLLYATGHEIDWEHVFERLGAELPLLGGLLNVFAWCCPEKALLLPENVREKFHLRGPMEEGFSRDPKERIDLLDTRPWFAAHQPKDKPMQI